MGSRFLTLCGFTVAQLAHLFFITVMGQFVANSNEEIFQRMYDRYTLMFWIIGTLDFKARFNITNMNSQYCLTCRYESEWYNCPLKVQSLYVLVLRKCLNPPAITGGGLIPLNLDSFVQVSSPFLAEHLTLAFRKQFIDSFQVFNNSIH